MCVRARTSCPSRVGMFNMCLQVQSSLLYTRSVADAVVRLPVASEKSQEGALLLLSPAGIFRLHTQCTDLCLFAYRNVLSPELQDILLASRPLPQYADHAHPFVVENGRVATLFNENLPEFRARGQHHIEAVTTTVSSR